MTRVLQFNPCLISYGIGAGMNLLFIQGPINECHMSPIMQSNNSSAMGLCQIEGWAKLKSSFLTFLRQVGEDSLGEQRVPK